LHVQIVPVLAQGQERNQLPVRNVAEQVKCVVFAKACSDKWSPQVLVVGAGEWALSLSRHVQSVLAKAARPRVSRTQSMYLAASTLAKLCASPDAVLWVLAAELLVICTCTLQLHNTRSMFEKMTTLFVTFH
jgi:hypothetical protein